MQSAGKKLGQRRRSRRVATDGRFARLRIESLESRWLLAPSAPALNGIFDTNSVLTDWTYRLLRTSPRRRNVGQRLL